jgi:hypothetical protein
MASFAPPEAEVIDAHTFAHLAPVASVHRSAPTNSVVPAVVPAVHSGAPPTPTATLSPKEAQALTAALTAINSMSAFISQPSNSEITSDSQKSTPHATKTVNVRAITAKTITAKHPRLTHEQPAVAVKAKPPKTVAIVVPTTNQTKVEPTVIRIKVKTPAVQKEITHEQPTAVHQTPIRMKIKLPAPHGSTTAAASPPAHMKIETAAAAPPARMKIDTAAAAPPVRMKIDTAAAAPPVRMKIETNVHESKRFIAAHVPVAGLETVLVA